MRCSLVISTICLILHLMPRQSLPTTFDKSHESAILIWNEWDDIPGWDHFECGCMVTTNRNYKRGNIDAVVIFVDLPYNLRPLKEINHTPNYLVVLTTVTPLSLAQNALYDHATAPFNFTMTYRLDSDIVWTYYYFSKLNEVDQRVQHFESPAENFMDLWTENQQYDLRKKLANKKLLAVYMMYEVNDYSLPESLYLQDLRHYITLDAFMGCTEYHDCSNYKFMLIFDPSYCPDYLHPQFYTALDKFVVPVLIGGSNLTHLAPPDSYISSSQFSKAKDLAMYLIDLGQDPARYEKFFWWRSKYQLQKAIEPYCKLCQELKKPRQHRNPDSFLHWWTQYQCSNRTVSPK
ncbi:hypothetical protein KR093_005281, partial [Drosophila rubida]